MLVVCTAVTIVGVLALLVAERRGSQAGKWACKPLASAGFLGAALAAGVHDGFAAAIVAGLALSLVGDVFLISKDKAAFRAGLVSFLLGHLAFAVAFLFRGVRPGATALALVALTGAALPIGRWLLPYVDTKMRVPVIAYVVVISTMVALAAGTVAAHGHAILLAAAVGFFLSDLAVARDRFVAHGFVNRLWGLPLYYGAQLLFAWSLTGV
ncbi:MAG: YhhN family protein [Myxococcales bacterium]|nr:YhhN family protein [Myxococcales bacterium]